MSISDLLKKHDKMFRQEIDDETESLKKEIEKYKPLKMLVQGASAV